MKAEVTALKHKDVDGNDQYYLVVEKGGQRYRMYVGQKTYETISKMDIEETSNQILRDHQQQEDGAEVKGLSTGNTKSVKTGSK